MVRSDLSPSQQAVQACHACLESGKLHPYQGEHPHLSLLTVPDEDSLRRWLQYVRDHNLKAVPFYEPDLNNSLTAFAVPGVCTPEERRVFAGLPTLKLAYPTTKEKKMTATKFESKWGFHPCSYETFKSLRRLNFLAYEARRRIAAHRRWERKLPENRRIFVGGANGWHGAKKNQIPKMHRVYRTWEEPVLPPIDLEMADIIAADYQNARMPVPEAQVRKLILSDARMAGLLKSLEAWHQGVPVEQAV